MVAVGRNVPIKWVVKVKVKRGMGGRSLGRMSEKKLGSKEEWVVEV
jgi:hypothetical protein